MRATLHTGNRSNPARALLQAHELDTAGRLEEAIDAYTAILACEPLNLRAHRQLNHLLYRLGRDGQFMRSYDEALAGNPAHPALLRDKAWFALNAHRYSESLAIYEQLLSVAPADPIAITGVAVSLEKLGRLAAAADTYRHALIHPVRDANLYSSLAAMLLQLGDPSAAETAARGGLEIAPHDQTCLAALSTAWRLRNDAREAWLCGYADLIRVFDLEPPPGFNDQREFNTQLNQELDRFHPDTREHVNQSVRGGTQTRADILGTGRPLVDLLQAQFNGSLRTYIRGLQDATHPFSARRSRSFLYTGSWSSRLHSGGFHANHIHPRGWISSCYYVGVPDECTDSTTQQGWLGFGAPSIELGLPEPIRRSVEPRVGRLVLFPSFVWHGTRAFHSAGARTTIAFDVAPTQ
jgi:Flp pilus assembly protein TadD